MKVYLAACALAVGVLSACATPAPTSTSVAARLDEAGRSPVTVDMAFLAGDEFGAFSVRCPDNVLQLASQPADAARLTVPLNPRMVWLCGHGDDQAASADWRAMDEPLTFANRGRWELD